jgi:hypothetical protein
MKKLMSFLSAVCCLFVLGFAAPTAMAQTTGEIAKGNCKSTAEVCQKTMDWCTKKGGKYAEASVTNSLKDCVTACKMTEDFLNRGSTLEAKSCGVCIDACNEAAKTCDKFADKEMAACANECRKCVGNCTKLASK